MNIKQLTSASLLFAALMIAGCNSSTSSGSQTSDAEETSSDNVPKGMKMVWNDEFNGNELDRTKWSTNYYSTLDYYYRTNFEDFRADNLPQPAMEFTGTSLILRTNDKVPERNFWNSGRKISSIQTYDWREDKNMMNNKLGGYFEARIRRSATPEAEMANSAFWFDSPGPDLRYYIEKGNQAHGVTGIRPRGQVFEIDLCEYITTEIVLHGNVSPTGEFERNIGHFIIPGQYNDKWTTHGMLWTPAGLKFYVDGKLVAESWDSNNIKSPNHTMNMFFGAYGKGGEVEMEVDYVRHYQWDLEEGNELPNPGFEYHNALFPWEGSATVTAKAARTGNYGAQLSSGRQLYQYVYLDHSRNYQLKFYAKGSGKLNVKVENITQVSGIAENAFSSEIELTSEYKEYTLPFTTNPEYGDHLRTVKVTFTNNETGNASVDDVNIGKVN